ncbi:MAG: aminotransferase class I/II-fold pyridoxal phosphate-dependent enzyme, partial [Wenzhouxiangellaceae bacterium]|nr:aminotransferase class I/II-fold pyridoxal phosphate-dependent enzyme [Wenzhouxiangellaceae bacterium]
APPLVAASIKVFEMLDQSGELRARLMENTRFFRHAMTEAGFDIKEGSHPIVPVMLYDAPMAQKMADALLEEGIYVIGFFYPVVPRGEARIRLQISAAHEREHLERAVDAFTRIGKKLGVIQTPA